jgi:hypothetical protein
MGNCGLLPFNKKAPAEAAAPEAEPEKKEEVVVGETSQTTEVILISLYFPYVEKRINDSISLIITIY